MLWCHLLADLGLTSALCSPLKPGTEGCLAESKSGGPSSHSCHDLCVLSCPAARCSL